MITCVRIANTQRNVEIGVDYMPGLFWFLFGGFLGALVTFVVMCFVFGASEYIERRRAAKGQASYADLNSLPTINAVSLKQEDNNEFSN